MELRKQIITPLLKICPAFKPGWIQLDLEWGDEYEGVPTYIALGEFAHVIVTKFEASEISDFPQIFALVEELILHEEQSVREAMTVGLLEGIQNICSSKEIDLKKFKPFLGEVSNEQWEQIILFWDGKIPYIKDNVS